jgi:hypothetical protein
VRWGCIGMVQRPAKATLCSVALHPRFCYCQHCTWMLDLEFWVTGSCGRSNSKLATGGRGLGLDADVGR